MADNIAVERDVKIAIIESKMLGLVDSIKRNEKSTKDIEKEIETRYEKIERCIELIEQKIWNLLRWTIGGFTSVIALLAHIKGWI